MSTRKKYNFGTLEIGESLEIEAATYKQQCKTRSAVSGFARYNDIVLRTAVDGDKIIVTREK